MASEIGAYDAKTHLPELLRKVRRGQRFTITHRGKPIAELIPAGGATGEDFEAAVEDMLDFEQIEGVDPADIEAWIAEGRR